MNSPAKNVNYDGTLSVCGCEHFFFEKIGTRFHYRFLC